MTSRYTISRLNDEELESAIDLMTAEHPPIIRNTATKMSDLILEQLDVKVEVSRVKKFFGFIENFENESLKIENYG